MVYRTRRCGARLFFDHSCFNDKILLGPLTAEMGPGYFWNALGMNYQQAKYDACYIFSIGLSLLVLLD